MTHMISLVRRGLRFRALPLVALAGGIMACESPERLTSTSEPLFSNDFAGGIPFGTFALPTSAMGDLFNGAMRNIGPKLLLKELAEIKDRGGKVVLMFAGNQRHYKGSDGRFSFSKWQERVDRFRGVNFSSYIEDGTIIGHYLIDEPNDDFNWGGQPVTGSMVEQMAAYSKQLWPQMGTIVRVEPGYLGQTGGPYQYLDAAWAQYVTRKGTASEYLRRNVADAERLNLGLIIGLNVRAGGPRRSEMTSSLIESAGSTFLEDPYPCAFISWQYNEKYLARPDIRAAMEGLSAKARAHSAQSCQGGRES